MNVYKIRVTGDVLDTPEATRRRAVDGITLAFGREPVYIRAAQVPPEIAADPYLQVEEVEFAPPNFEILKLKAERVQEPEAAAAVTRLKAERVQEPEAAVAVTGGKKRGTPRPE
jgi:hypothetical protein